MLLSCKQAILFYVHSVMYQTLLKECEFLFATTVARFILLPYECINC